MIRLVLLTLAACGGAEDITTFDTAPTVCVDCPAPPGPLTCPNGHTCPAGQAYWCPTGCFTYTPNLDECGGAEALGCHE